MKRTILLGTAISLAFWATSLCAQGQTQNPTPVGDQPQARARDGSGVNHDQVQQNGPVGKMNKQGQQNGNGQKGANGKGAQDGSGNKGNRPLDGIGNGSQSGQRGGSMKGAGTAPGDWSPKQQGNTGVWERSGGGRANTTRSTAGSGGRSARGGGRR